MNEQLQLELTKIITNINSGVTTLWDFLGDQTPDIVSQLLMWYCTLSALWCIISVCLFILAIIAFIKLRRWAKGFVKQYKDDHNGYNGDSETAYVVPFVVIIVLGFLSLLSFSIEWLQILIAPKVWLLEYITTTAVSVTK